MFYTSARVKELKKPRKGYMGVLSYKDAEGRWQQKSKMLRAANKTAAKRELQAWHAEMERIAELAGEDGVRIHAQNVSEYLSSYVQKLEETNAIEGATVRTYKDSISQIGKKLGKVKVSNLTAKQIESWIRYLIGEGYSSSTVGKAFRLLKQALQNAVNTGALEKNPAVTVKPPKRVKKNPGINALDTQARGKVLAVIDAMEPTPTTIAALIAMYSGLRRGEVCGLRWDDLDFANGTMWIRRTVGIKEGGTYIKQPKTDKVRDVVLPQTLIEKLAAWKQKQAEAFESLGVETQDAYIVGSPKGYADPTTLGKNWHELAKMIGVVGTEGRLPTFHDLRHTWATMYLAAGGDVKTAASNLGHANAAMTLNVYASADPDAKRRAAQLVDSVIR